MFKPLLVILSSHVTQSHLIARLTCLMLEESVDSFWLWRKQFRPEFKRYLQGHMDTFEHYNEDFSYHEHKKIHSF